MPRAAPVTMATRFVWTILDVPLRPRGALDPQVPPLWAGFFDAKQWKFKYTVLYSRGFTDLPLVCPFRPHGKHRGSDPTGGYDGIDANGAYPLSDVCLWSTHRRLCRFVDLAEPAL